LQGFKLIVKAPGFEYAVFCEAWQEKDSCDPRSAVRSACLLLSAASGAPNGTAGCSVPFLSFRLGGMVVPLLPGQIPALRLRVSAGTACAASCGCARSSNAAGEALSVTVGRRRTGWTVKRIFSRAPAHCNDPHKGKDEIRRSS